VGVCWGTKEQEHCDCEGDRSKCTFYREKAESESAYENLGHIAVPETIDFTPIEDILTSKYIDPPMRELVYWFNKCGFATSGHCYGHETNSSAFVSFRECVTDKMFADLLSCGWTNYFGDFYKQMWLMTSNNNIQYPYGTIMYMWHWGASTAKDAAIEGCIRLLKKYYNEKLT